MGTFRLIVVMAASLMGTPAAADGGADRARAALRAGQIVSLDRILNSVRRDFAGDIISVELDLEDRTWVYEVKLLTARGALVKLDYDAGNAVLLRTKGVLDSAVKRN